MYLYLVSKKEEEEIRIFFSGAASVALVRGKGKTNIAYLCLEDARSLCVYYEFGCALFAVAV
jgi:hypothetical protein